jgi:hypothetical protein
MAISVSFDIHTYTYMVEIKTKIIKSQKHLCRGCGKTKARFRYRDRIKARNDHDLCFRCNRTYRAAFHNAARFYSLNREL